MITLVENTIIDAIKAEFPTFPTVRRLSTSDIAEADGGATQTLMVKPTAVLLYFTGAQLVQRAMTGKLYDQPLSFDVFVITQDLSGDDAARDGAYDVLNNLMNLLAGLKLANPHGQVFLAGIEPVSIERGKAVYRLAIEVRTVFQAAA